MRKQWLSWMISEGIIHGTSKPPSCRDVAGRVDRAMEEMKREEQISKNSWSKTWLEWFPKEGGKIAIAAAVTNEGDKNKEIPVLVETSTEEDKAIVGVLNRFLEDDLFNNMMEGGKEEEEVFTSRSSRLQSH
jgi:hypothetical protein